MNQMHIGHRVSSKKMIQDAVEAMHEYRAGRASFSALVAALISPFNPEDDLPNHSLLLGHDLSDCDLFGHE